MIEFKASLGYTARLYLKRMGWGEDRKTKGKQLCLLFFKKKKIHAYTSADGVGQLNRHYMIVCVCDACTRD
jgi:hypothetical protein